MTVFTKKGPGLTTASTTSSTATGASFTGSTVMATDAALVVLPASVMR